MRYSYTAVITGLNVIPFPMSRCAVRSALERHEEEDEEEEGEWELPTKRVRANMRMLLGEAPKTLCLHFPRRHQR